MTYASANFVAPFNYTQMIGSVIVGYLMFAEVPDLYTWLGTALIVGAGLMVGWQGRGNPKPEEGTMPYLVAADLPTAPAGVRFRALLDRPGILQMPGTHNGMAALQARGAGFEALYLSGAAMSASMGLPDLGVITVDEVCFFVRQVARASGLPVLVDGDTGYGEALNVMHMVRAFEEAGAGAVHIEDQILPKKCGHLNNKKLADPHDMAAKVAAAARARRDLVIIARTDAAASEGIDGAVARARRYLEAGADAIFPEALNNAEMFRAFAKAMPGVKLLANMTEFGRTPFFTASEFEAMGYRMVIWPVSAFRVANKAQERLYAALRRDGGTQNMLGPDADPRRALRARSATTSTRRSTPRSSRRSCRKACRSAAEPTDRAPRGRARDGGSPSRPGRPCRTAARRARRTACRRSGCRAAGRPTGRTAWRGCTGRDSCAGRVR